MARGLAASRALVEEHQGNAGDLAPIPFRMQRPQREPAHQSTRDDMCATALRYVPLWVPNVESRMLLKPTFGLETCYGPDMPKPVLLDLFCGAGGASMGYHQAGWEVVGVDHEPQPHYPFEFIQDDALIWLTKDRPWWDALHASPPCQAFSNASYRNKRLGRWYEDLVTPTRDALRRRDKPYVIENVIHAPIRRDKPYVIENVIHAPIRRDLLLCGTMFLGLRVIRHRIFESNVPLPGLPHHKHPPVYNRETRRDLDQETGFVTVAGESARVGAKRSAMEIDWMFDDEINEAIPPAYTRYIGKQLLTVLH